MAGSFQVKLPKGFSGMSSGVRHLRTASLCMAMVAACGCTAIHVEALSSSALPTMHVCIEKNSKVVIGDFVDAVRDGFDRHGISTELYESQPPPACKVTVTYTARQSWDLVSYLSQAEVRLWRDGRRIAYAEYHLRGKGGFALTKFESTASKMRPVMDKLLKEYRRSLAADRTSGLSQA